MTAFVDHGDSNQQAPSTVVLDPSTAASLLAPGSARALQLSRKKKKLGGGGGSSSEELVRSASLGSNPGLNQLEDADAAPLQQPCTDQIGGAATRSRGLTSILTSLGGENASTGFYRLNGEDTTIAVNDPDNATANSPEGPDLVSSSPTSLLDRRTATDGARRVASGVLGLLGVGSESRRQIVAQNSDAPLLANTRILTRTASDQQNGDNRRGAE